jgi:23S rRNA pseudouridine1911/1915/1917 synthase
MATREWIIETTHHLERLDKVLSVLNEDLSRSYIQTLIKNGFVLVNELEAKANQKLKEGDEVVLDLPDQQSIDIIPEPMDLDILYEDHDLLVINKPKGLVVHPGAGNSQHTLVHGLMAHCTDLSGINGILRPGIVHRIDKDTSGCLVVAKHDQAHQHLSEQLQNKTLHRVYWALVHGELAHNLGTIEAPIGRDPKDRQRMIVTAINARDAITHFSVVQRYQGMTLLECRLETGRTHQIRVHLHYIKHPVVGDLKYGPRNTPDTQGQCLHAKSIEFVHPRTLESMRFEAPLPAVFQSFLDQLEVSV